MKKHIWLIFLVGLGISSAQAQSQTGLELQPPAGWNPTTTQNGVVVYRPANAPDSEVLVFPPGPCTANLPSEPLKKFLTAIEKGRTALQGTQTQPMQFYTSQGLPITTIIRATQGEKPPLQLMQSTVFTLGCRYQLVTLHSGKKETFLKHVKEWEKPLQEAKISQGAPTPAAAFPSQTLKFFNYSIQIPQKGSLESRGKANQTTLDWTPKLVFELEEDLMPHAPIAALRVLNMQKTSLAPEQLKNELITLDSAHNWQLKTGPAVMAEWTHRYQPNKFWPEGQPQTLTAGVLIPYQGFRLRITMVDPMRQTSDAGIQGSIQRFKEYKALLPKIVMSIKWHAVKRRPDLEDWLIQKKTFKYSRYSQISTTSQGYTSNTTTAVTSSTNRDWQFKPNRTVILKMDEKYLGVSGTETGAYGGLLGQSFQDKENSLSDPKARRFSVWNDANGTNWLITSRPGGSTHFHKLEIGKNIFSIDGDNELSGINESK